MSINRRLITENKITGEDLNVKLLPDIEYVDEPRFFYTKNIEFKNKKHPESLIVRDTFALALEH